MPREFTLPELGEGIETAEVASVLVEAGDRVAKDQSLLEVETDKAAIEIPSPHDGVIAEVHCQAGDKLPPGALLVTFVDGDEADQPEAEPATDDARVEEPAAPEPAASTDESASPPPLPSPEKPKPSAARPESKAPRSVSAGPATRKLARELGVDLSGVTGTGPRGRVTPADVKAHVKTALGGGATTEQAVVIPELPDFSQWGPVHTEPFRSVRKLTADHMALAWSQAPRVTQFDTADITELESFRKRHAGEVAEAGGKLTVTVFAVKACAAVLGQFPEFCSSLDLVNHQLVMKDYYHVGMAVDTPRGLLVPVIRDVDQKPIPQLARELVEISERARAGKIMPDELRGGCFTITNLGGIGGTAFTPIVNFPEVAILGLARTQTELKMVDGHVEERLMLPLCVSYDHRVIDGANAARFTRRLAELLEDPGRLLLTG